MPKEVIPPAAPAANPTPAAPAPATPAPSTPAPAPTPQAAAPSAPAGDAGDPFEDFDRKLTEQFDIKPEVKPPATPEAGKTPEPKPGEKPKPEVKPAAKPPEAGGPKQLREQYESTKAERDALAIKVADFEKRIADAESKGKDTTALAEKLAKAESRQAEMEAELRAARQEVSPEFKQKYDEPFNRAAEYAKRDIEQLVVIDEDEGTQRAATWEDFIGIYRLPKGKAIMEARRLFGPEQAQIAMGHLADLQRLDYQRNAALEQEKATWAERETSRVAAAAQEREATQQMWKKVNDDIKAKRPEWFGEDPEDEEGNKLLAEGYRLVDTAFSNREALTPQQRVTVDAQVRNRAAAFPRTVMRLRKANAEISELKAKLAEYEASAPGETRNPGGGAPAPKADNNSIDDMARDLREAVKE